MVREIVTDAFQLRQKAALATEADLAVVRDLIDTLTANRHRCVGMAANMIGVNKRIIVVDFMGIPVAMINPIIVKRSKETYETQEGCLSLSGTRATLRYQSIDVEFLDTGFQTCRQTYSGWVAQIIQHEIDHCEGILI